MTHVNVSRLVAVVIATLAVSVSTARADDGVSPCGSHWRYGPPYGFCTNATGLSGTGSGEVLLILVGRFHFHARLGAVGAIVARGSAVNASGAETVARLARDDDAGALVGHPLIYGHVLDVTGNCPTGCYVRVWARSWTMQGDGYGEGEVLGSAQLRTTAGTQYDFKLAGTLGRELTFGGDNSHSSLLWTGTKRDNSGELRVSYLPPQTQEPDGRLRALISYVGDLRGRFS